MDYTKLPLPERGLGRFLALMFWAVFGYGVYDANFHFESVEARLTRIYGVTCYVEKGYSKSRPRTRNMSCDKAALLASSDSYWKFGRVIQFVDGEFSYVSPADGQPHRARVKTRWGGGELKIGNGMVIRASNRRVDLIRDPSILM